MNPDTPNPVDDRLLDLLADRATVGLTADEHAELEALLAANPEVDADEFDRAASAVHLAALGPLPELPESLLAKLNADAQRRLPPPVPSTLQTPTVGRRFDAFAWSGWLVAACLLIGLVYSAWPEPQPKTPTVAEKRDALLASQKSTEYASARDPNKPSGKVVWSHEKQEGYLEVRGLPPNDPTKRQYQLWIVDSKRPHKEPVDGGVFDVPASGEVLVPIRAPLAIREAALFAVTEEPPGGVVVSEKGKLGQFEVVMTPETP